MVLSGIVNIVDGGAVDGRSVIVNGVDGGAVDGRSVTVNGVVGGPVDGKSVIVNGVDGGAVDGTIRYFRRLWIFCIGPLPVTIPEASRRLGPARIQKYF